MDGAGSPLLPGEAVKEHDFRKYLKKCRLLPVEPRPLEAAFRAIAVVPACDELDEIGATLDALLPAVDEAVLVVVNHPEEAAPRVRDASAELLRRFRSGGIARPNLFWIDAPDLTGGVGEARKLGMDAVIASQPPDALEATVIASLDADTVVEPDYFPGIRRAFAQDSALAALSIPFRHRPGATPEEEAAIRRYEAYLDRYVSKLREAGSPYAFHTVGSAFAVRASAYVRCGGMRVRKGGEDFYFLQAAAKTGKLVSGDRVLVHPSPRPSARVPFGTGPAVRKLMDGVPPSEISDAAFELLRNLLTQTAELEDSERFLDRLDPVSAAFLRNEDFDAAWPRILVNTPNRPAARLAAFHNWFDGLRTLRFLHEIERKR